MPARAQIFWSWSSIPLLLQLSCGGGGGGGAADANPPDASVNAQTFDAQTIDSSTPPGELLAAVTQQRNLLLIDPLDPGSATAKLLTGISASESLRGIEYRPSNGLVYLITVVTASASNSRVFQYVFEFDSPDAVFYQASILGATVPLAGAGDVPTGFDLFDFNDEFRYVNTNDENARLTGNSGAMTANNTDLTPAATSSVIALALQPGELEVTTTAFAIDRNDSTLAIMGGLDGVPSANGGVITDLDPLGFTLNQVRDGGFEITPGGKAYAALTDLADDLTHLYEIDLTPAVGIGARATDLGLIGAGADEIVGLTTLPR